MTRDLLIALCGLSVALCAVFGPDLYRAARRAGRRGRRELAAAAGPVCEGLTGDPTAALCALAAGGEAAEAASAAPPPSAPHGGARSPMLARMDPAAAAEFARLSARARARQDAANPGAYVLRTVGQPEGTR